MGEDGQGVRVQHQGNGALFHQFLQQRPGLFVEGNAGARRQRSAA